MKRIILLLIFTVISSLIINAKDYRVVKIQGKCEVLLNNKWQLLKTNDIITSSSIIKALDENVFVYINLLETTESIRIKLEKEKPKTIGELMSNPIWTAFVKVFSFIFTPPENARISAAYPGHTSLGDCDFACDSLGASLLAKMNGKFGIDKITNEITDYDVFMRFESINNSPNKYVTLYNFSDDSLYVLILEMSKRAEPISIHYPQKEEKREQLLKISGNSVIELPEEIEMKTEHNYFLIASKNNFNIDDLLQSINSNCECKLKSNMPLGIYLFE